MKTPLETTLIGLFVAFCLSSNLDARQLTMDERVAAQTAIERVYWAHRIWPAENPGPKPPFEDVISESAIRTKVEDDLRESSVLATYWGRPIRAAQLQAEMERMAAETRDPGLLTELFAALGNDPYVLAECLARPILADRLAREWFASDERIHASVRAEAERAVSTYRSSGSLRRIAGSYSVLSYRRDAGHATGTADSPGARALEPQEWNDLIRELSQRLGLSTATEPSMRSALALPMNVLSQVYEDDAGFHVLSVLDRGTDTVRVAIATWPKISFETWLRSQRLPGSSDVDAIAAKFTAVTPALTGCTQDTWSPTRQDNTDGRTGHVAVWTGTEMLVWGGSGLNGLLNTGARYNAATDAWTFMSVASAPSARYSAAVWTGSKMLVWGGSDGNTTYYGDGAAYDPSSNTWTALSGVGAPSARSGFTPVWTGSKMIVWGGSDSGFFNTGGLYDPVANSWQAMSTTNAPIARTGQATVWTGVEMVVWGGGNSITDFNTGARYNPSTDTWVATTTTGAPQGVRSLTAVWTGSKMIVWGGWYFLRFYGAVYVNTGGIYDPVTDSWTSTTLTGAPTARSGSAGVWTGTRLVVWGGYGMPATGGGRYDPVADAWTPTSSVNAPSDRSGLTGVWTGSEMIVWGGGYTSDPNFSPPTGGRYNPASDSWVPVARGTTPTPRQSHSSVWTGVEMIVWGGGYVSLSLQTGGRYSPATNSWTATSTASAPAARFGHTAVWTGTRMVVWGGGASSGPTGGRYDPATDTWLPTTTAGAPLGTQNHTAVWTGTEMIVWGGRPGSNTVYNTGGRYSPSSDSWVATSTTNAPAAREHHMAVWTGSSMLVWGGLPGPFADGGRYSPATDTWTPISTLGAPQGRSDATAVWTGTAMIVWGGVNGSVQLASGGRYLPAADAWTPTSTAGAPSARTGHRAVWTGSDMIVWGGATATGDTATGGRYTPASDTWAATGSMGVPTARSNHQAAYTGHEMVVWGGSDLTPTGGRYCACPNGATFYRDADGDGFGDPNVRATVCSGIEPAGYVAMSGDCDDSNPTIYPEAPQLCDGLNNDCLDPYWPAMPPEEADADGDGFRICAGDCDDTQATVYPGAPQICDGLNDNCNDPGWPAVPVNEADADGDGFRICAGDCKDTDASVYPGAPQLCDGKNNNCLDPNWPTVPANEADADGDGYRICAGDCNDGNAAVHPGAAEVCNNIDDNCNGQVDEDAAGVDSDGDGVHNACDNCRFSPNPTQLDSDGDHVGNACDNCISVQNPNQADTDGDGRGDACDNCPLNANPTQDDGDADRVGDVCDNCPFDYNPSQSDFDHDGEGDACDLNDGLIYEWRDDKTSVTWQQEQGPSSWNLYIGDLSVLRATGVYTQVPGSNALASRDCGEASTFAADPSAPAVGQTSYSLVTGVTSGVEGTLGSSSSGTRPNANPCP